MSSSSKEYSKLLFAWLLSLSLALPSTGLAKPAVVEQAPEGAIEAALIPIPGSSQYIAIAPIPEHQQQSVLDNLLSETPDTSVIALAGEKDSAFQAIARHPNIDYAHIAVANKPEDLGFLNTDLPRSLRDKVLTKIRQFRTHRSVEKVGLLLSFTAATAAAGSNFYASGNYLSAVGLLGVLFGFNAGQYFFQNQWQRVKDRGRNAVVDLAHWISQKVGRELTPDQQEKLGVSGEFHVAWLANSLVAASALYLTSGSQEPGFLLMFQALVAGFVANQEVWDYTVRRYEKIQLVTSRFSKSFVLFRMFLATIFDCLSNMQLIGSPELITGFITLSGFVWLLAGDKVERELALIKSRREAQRAQRDLHSRALYELMRNSRCHGFLKGRRAS